MRAEQKDLGLLGGREGLAVVQRLQDGQLVGVLFHQVSKLVQDGASLTPGHARPGTVVKGLYHTFQALQSKMWSQRNKKEKTTPFGVKLMRSQVLYRAAQVWSQTHNISVTDVNLELILCSSWTICNHFVLRPV